MPGHWDPYRERRDYFDKVLGYQVKRAVGVDGSVAFAKSYEKVGPPCPVSCLKAREVC
jgi:hypothetical protein